MTGGGCRAPALDVGGLVGEVTDLVGSAAEARWIVAHALGTDATGLHAGRHDAVGPPVRAEVLALTQRRRRGEPLQYVLGRWAFRTLDLDVDPRVLIPRPETEVLVDVALSELARQAGPGRGGPTVAVDVGTGSGAIALALAAESPVPLQVWATDVSPAALAVARHNLLRLRAERPAVGRRVRMLPGSWFEPLPGRLAGRVAVVASNPPYVSEEEWLGLDPVVRDHEPKGALVPGSTGFEAIEVVLTHGRRWLAPGGAVVVELAPAQADRALDAAAGLGYDDAAVVPDLAGRLRVLCARAPGPGRRGAPPTTPPR